ncbi:beta-ketoacyl synthase N-terminal-like domain-containing protein [Streptomyces sp. NPDC001422]|uniref:beta-ketoacyl [acyl carrier protein] synthase domain-containing protein n=1 Tax=Streptomyces sp. NPDC001422 TaxID=3364575 RepID=UPI0036B838F0
MDVTADLMDEREVLTRFKAGRLERAQAVRILTALMSTGTPRHPGPQQPLPAHGAHRAAGPGTGITQSPPAGLARNAAPAGEATPGQARSATPAPVNHHPAPAAPARPAHAPARTTPAPAPTTPSAPAARTPSAPPAQDPSAPMAQGTSTPVGGPAGEARIRETGAVGADGPEADLDRYAVVGIAGRYPGAADLHLHWHNLREGRDTSCAGPLDRPGGPLLEPGLRGHFLAGAAEFDAEFFGLDPAEAALMDPQARLFQEIVWEALEDAGHTGSRLDRLTGPDGSPRAVGVFAGVSSADYALLAAQDWSRGRPMPAAGHGDLAARLAARLRLSGPAHAVDSAATSALAAVHLAVGALRRGECAAAVAGGVELLLHPSRARDTAGEGAGALVLKPLARALADGDHIHAVLSDTTCPSPRLPAPSRQSGPPVPGPGVRESEATTARRIGDAGAATGIAALTSAVLQLRTATLAPAPGRPAAKAWPRPRTPHGQELPRTALVELAPAHGPRLTVLLEEFPPPPAGTTTPRPAPAPAPAPAHAAGSGPAPVPGSGPEQAAAVREELVLLSAPTPAHLAALAARLADWIAPAATRPAEPIAPAGTEPADRTTPSAAPGTPPVPDTTPDGGTPAAPASVPGPKPAPAPAVGPPPSLGALARTLRTGRAALPCRLALTVRDLPQLHTALTRFAAQPHSMQSTQSTQSTQGVQGVQGEGTVSADLRSAPHDPYALAGVPETGDYLAALWHAGRLEQLRRLWLSGLPVDWAALERRSGAGAMVVPLPPSPLLRRPLWLGDTHPTAAAAHQAGRAGAAGEPS